MSIHGTAVEKDSWPLKQGSSPILINTRAFRFVSQPKLSLSKSKEIDAWNKRPTWNAQFIVRCLAAKGTWIPWVHLVSQCADVIQWGQPRFSLYSLGFVSCRNWRRPLLEQIPLSLGQCCLNTDKCWLPTLVTDYPFLSIHLLLVMFYDTVQIFQTGMCQSWLV